MKKYNTLIFFFSVMTFSGFGQHFTFHSKSPFGIEANEGTKITTHLMFFDIDGDGDLDLFITGIDTILNFDTPTWNDIRYFIDLQENIGDKAHPLFAQRGRAYEDYPYPLGYFFPAIGDLNADGKADFIINGIVDYIGNRTMTYVRNLGHSGSFDYEVTRFDSLGISDFVPESVFMPELVDLDQDGDLDLLMSGFDPAFAVEDGSDVPKYYYAKNIGTATAPQFEGWYENPYGLTANPLKEFTSAGDIDNDGDIDILASTSDIPSDSINKLYVHLNTPDVNGKPSFTSTLTSPYNLPETFGDNQLFFPNLVDIDGDGDLDLFVFEGTATGLELYYFENSLCTSTVIQTDVDLCVGDSVVIGGIAYFDEGDYVLSVPGPNGCDSVIMLTINQLPDVNNSVDLNGIVLTANLFNADYQWFDCNSGVNVPGATSQVFIASSSGNYAVRITDASGCVGVSACFSIFIDGVENTSLSNAISIYPDPSDDFIYLENTTQYPVTSITIRSVFGLNMGDIKVRGNKAIDVSFLGKGIYFVQMNINGYVVIKKLIVN